MPRTPDRRRQVVRRLASALDRRGAPRLVMFGIVMIATLTGFLASVVLRHVGFEWMSIRYPLAVVLAYVAFLIGLRLFASAQRVRRRRASPNAGDAEIDPPIASELPLDLAGEFVAASLTKPAAPPQPMLAEAPEGSTAGAGGSKWSLGDGDGLVLLVVGLILVALGAAAYACVAVVLQAPLLLAEVLADSLLAAGLTRRFRDRPVETWSDGAVAHTWKPALVVFVTFSLVGLALDALVPGASTMTDAFLAAWSRKSS